MDKGGISQLDDVLPIYVQWLTSSKHCHLRHASSSTPEDLSESNPNSYQNKSHTSGRDRVSMSYVNNKNHIPSSLSTSSFLGSSSKKSYLPGRELKTLIRSSIWWHSYHLTIRYTGDLVELFEMCNLGSGIYLQVIKKFNCGK